VIDGKLHAIVRADEAMWQLQDSHRLVITVPKLQIERPTWWPCLIVGDPEINTDRCEEGQATNLLYPTGERRLRVQKIELPESSDPNKKYDPKQAEKAWKDFFTRFPDMSAWEVTLKPTVNPDGTVTSVEDQLVDTLGKVLGKTDGEWEKAGQ